MERRQRLLAPRRTRRRGGLIAPALVAALAAALTACGDGDGPGSSGVDGDKALTELSPDEATDLCEWGLSLLDGDELERVDCYLEALLSTEDAAMCEEVAQACIEDIELPDPDDLECTFEDPPACGSQVAVAEIEACVRDSVALIDDVIAAVDCDFNLEDIDDLAIEQPASCGIVEEKCPALFGDDEDGEARTSAGRWMRGARRADRMIGLTRR